ncbi:hypothetical protein AWC09_00020 [Mycolicibacter hiberniae]|nr:hypothetical protein AWC09_00020 [Mycolicibacter hiberniae]
MSRLLVTVIDVVAADKICACEPQCLVAVRVDDDSDDVVGSADVAEAHRASRVDQPAVFTL